MEEAFRPSGRTRKRKAESQDLTNDRLSKRLSFLNLEHNGQKLYVPVESPPQPTITSQDPDTSTKPILIEEDDSMHVDNTSHKVYIYNLDDEISDSESSADEGGKLVFLPELKKHLLESRIPQSIRANADGDLAGINLNNELVLYNVPNSLTVSGDKDSVRKAIIETRARAQERQRKEREAARTASTSLTGLRNGVTGVRPQIDIPAIAGITNPPPACQVDDPDAMELD